MCSAGTGVLTEELLKHGSQLTAIENDRVNVVAADELSAADKRLAELGYTQVGIQAKAPFFELLSQSDSLTSESDPMPLRLVL